MVTVTDLLGFDLYDLIVLPVLLSCMGDERKTETGS